MNIWITGVSGFIGRFLSDFFTDQGHRVIGLSRNPQKARKILSTKIEIIQWDGKTPGEWSQRIKEAHVVINLAGANIGARYWTESYKQEILESRLNAGKVISQAILQSKIRPQYLVQASAIGFYGSGGDKILDESATKGQGFLADVVQQWEDSVAEVEAAGVKRIIMRLGVVLGQGGGLVSRMKWPFYLFVGGPLGNPANWLSWIHISEIPLALEFLWQQKLSGVFNFTAPEPVQMGEFARTLGKVLQRPAFFRVPERPLKILLGEMAEELIFSSQRVLPKRLVNEGYLFKFPTLYLALSDIFGKRELPM